MHSLEMAALRWATGLQRSADLPNLAAEALAGGADSPELRVLAGLSPDDYWEIKRAFETTLREFGIELLEEQDALWQLARDAARRIVDDETAPEVGARWIWANVSNRLGREGDLRIFVGLASVLEDHPEQRSYIEQHIRRAAEELLERDQPRRWVRLEARSGRFPVADAKSLQPIDPSELPISGALLASLWQWAKSYESSSPLEPSSGAGFASSGDAADFVDQGRELAAHLQQELGDEWHVEYYPEATQPPGLRLRGAQA